MTKGGWMNPVSPTATLPTHPADHLLMAPGYGSGFHPPDT